MVQTHHSRLLDAWSLLALLVATSFLACSRVPVTVGLPPAILVENHSDVLVPWIRTGIRGATVVNVDAHDDCTPIIPENIRKLRRMHAAGDVVGIGRANGVADSGLYNIGDYLTAAHALGIARKVVWVAPQQSALSKVFTHLPFRVWPMDSLAALRTRGPVLLTVDADCVNPYANYECINLVEAVRRIAEALRNLPGNVAHVSVAFSCDGGYLPLTIRWVGNAMQEALDGKDILRTDAPWLLLVKVEDWRRGLLPVEVARRVRPLVLEQPANPWLRVYLADALFRSDDVSGALEEGKKAALLDSGCGRILPELGEQLASAGRLEEAELFLAAAPALVNAAAEFALAQGLDRAGEFAKAIKHYQRISEQTANYSADLLIGYCYERMGDPVKARPYYLRAVSLLARPVSEMAGFADLTLPVAAAVRFFEANGDRELALVLRRDHRLVNYFVKEGTPSDR